MAKRVLVVDDDPNTVRFLSVALEENGYEPIAALTSLLRGDLLPTSAIRSMPGLAKPPLSQNVTSELWVPPIKPENKLVTRRP